MPTIKNTFHLQVMDKETDSAFVENGRTRHVENLRFGTNGGNDGVGVNIKGTEIISDLTDGNTNFKCVGAEHNDSDNTIYYMLATTDGVISKVAEYNIDDDSDAVILHDTTSILNLKKNGYITGINEIDGMLFWSEFDNNPRRVNIERAKNYGVDGYTEEDIQVILIPPHQKPTITLQSTGSDKENNIEEKFLYFAYQWKYLDGDYSIISPFSEAGFIPSNFDYDFSTQSNRAMVNKFNQVKIEFNTGNERVTDIRLIFKESQSNSEWIIDDFNKAKMGYGDNETQSFLFDNSKAFKALSNTMFLNIGNSVPRTAKAQTIIDGRLIYAHYKEFYNLLDNAQQVIDIDYSLELVALSNSTREGDPLNIIEVTLPSVTHAVTALSLTLTITTTGLNAYNMEVGDPVTLTLENAGAYTITSVNNTTLVLEKNELPYPTYNGVEANAILFILTYAQIPTLIPKKTVKSYREYEVGMVYLDAPCRPTTILVSKTNTLFIPNDNCITENYIDVVLKHNPPSWAKYYRFFIKQPKKNYDTILPLLFYTDGVYRWIKLEGADKDKFNEGDYLIVKSDINGVLTPPKKVKVLEVKSQEENFISTDTEGEIGEKAGLYFKIKPENFRINELDLIRYSLTCSDGLFLNSIYGSTSYISNTHFYGTGLHDLTSGGTYTGATGDRNRFIIEIDGEGTGGSGVDTYRWSKDDGATWDFSTVDIVAGAVTLFNGVQITFANTTGHTNGNQWVINARAIWSVNFIDRRPYGFFRTVNKHNELLDDVQDEIIYAGARIKLEYTENGGSGESFTIDEISSDQYDNIQEWFYKENIISLIIGQCDLELSNIHFMRGVINKISSEGDRTTITQNDTEGTMTMCVQSKSSTYAPVVNSYSEIIQSDYKIGLIFETEPEEQPLDLFYEIGKTYTIENNYHIADSSIPTDVDQSSGVDLRVKLDFFNSFSFGNGVESYKVKDEFNKKGVDVGIRTLTTIEEEYKEVTRVSDVTWSGLYEDEANFNQLSFFNLSAINFIKLDKEEGSVQLLHNDNGNLLVIQEDAIGLMPYNKNVIYDTEGGSVVGVANNVLDRKSYSAYAKGRYGSKNPESFVSRGSRKYIIDQSRGKLLRLSVDGITPVSDKYFDHYFSRLMALNRGNFMVAGYDPKHGEYLFNIPNTVGVEKSVDTNPTTYSFKEKAGGFPLLYTFDPDYILEADNEVYAWKNGVMHKLNASETRNNFFGVQYNSYIKFFVNQEFSVEKVFTNLGLESTHPWQIKLATKLTSRQIQKTSFNQKEDYWFSEIMGNTNSNTKSLPIYGLGSYAINNGVITIAMQYPSLSVGDYISSNTLGFAPSKVIDITETQIILEDSITETSSFLKYQKNASIDGSDIRGDVLDVEMTSDETEEVQLRAVNTQVTKSNYS